MAAERNVAGAQARAIRFISVEKLTAYARNARTHSEAQIAQIAASIDEFGFTNPVLADERGIVAGHGRVLAVQKLYAEGRSIRLPNGEEVPAGCVPVLDVSGLTDEQRRAYILADNQHPMNAGWDKELLAAELTDLEALGFDLSLIGFSEDELKVILAPPGNDGEGDAEETPEPPVNPVTRAGDVWLLGRHRIICGDSTVATDVEKVLNGVKPHLCVTDPPYGVEYDAGWRNDAMPAKNDPKRWKDGAGSPTGAVLHDDKADWREAWDLFPGDVMYVWHAGLYAGVVAESLIACGFNLRSQIIWAKQQFAIGRGDYHWQHEPCWYAVKKGEPGRYAGGRKQSTLWEIPKPQRSETGHSTQKPVECMRRPIENNSEPGDGVYEPFSGSGTTIIACEQTGRTCYAVELSPEYVDVAVRRWENFTGQAATLEGDGRTFAELAQERVPDAAAA